MELTRRSFAQRLFTGVATVALAPFVLFDAACGTSTVAALVATLGGAAASIATALGDTALAEKITTDTAAVVTAVNAWKAGTGTVAAVVAILNVVLADINLIPVSPLYQTLISLALTTITALITIFAAGTTTAMKSAYNAAVLAGAPKDRDHFKSAWNTICAGDARLATVKIK